MLTVTACSSSLVVAPEHGAALIGWMLGRTPILRRALPQASVSGDPHAMACFPLLPTCNRVGEARFQWRGTEHLLTRNFGDHPHTLHGVGWQRAWSVEKADAGSVALTLDHQPDASWPFAFQAGVRYSLSPAALTIDIRLTSRHSVPAPAGIGLHPYFPKQTDAWLRFDATGVWTNGPGALPQSHGTLPAAWQHRDSRPVARSRLDNCFTGWTRTADIAAGPASLRIEASEAFRHLQVFTPSWADFFCVEPVSHIPNALNRTDLPPDQAMHILEPNETLSGTIRLCPVVIRT